MLHLPTLLNCNWNEQRYYLFYFIEKWHEVINKTKKLPSYQKYFSESLFLGSASVERLIVQHPLNDTDNSLFLWAQLRHRDTTHLILMSTLPNEQKASNELLFIPRFSYIPPQCAQFLAFRSVVLDRHQATALGNSDDDDVSRDSNSSFTIRESARFNQLMLFLHTERNANDFALRV